MTQAHTSLSPNCPDDAWRRRHIYWRAVRAPGLGMWPGARTYRL